MTSKQWVEQRIKYFWEQKRTYEASKANFENDKYEFYNEMDRYFDEVADDDGKFGVSVKETVKGIGRIVCQKISTVSISFDVKKIRKVLTKEQQKQVIQKHYKVINWPKMFQLLKDSGVEWKEFLKCVEVSETVNQKELDKLIDLGYVDMDDIKKCASTKVKNVYYKLTEK